MEYPNFVGPSYISQAVTADNEELYNFYVEPLEVPGATTRYALYPTPGVENLGSEGSGPGRAHYAVGGREFAVIGASFVEIDQAGTVTVYGSVSSDGRPATICSSGDAGGEVFITAGTNGYLFNLATNTFSTIAALAGIAVVGAYLDGYFFALDTALSRLYASELLDGATWNTGTSFTDRTIAPDPWISMIVADRRLWMIGTQTSEAWINRGLSPFPFEPDPSLFVEFGTCATFSVTLVDGAPMWLDATHEGQGRVLRLAGYTPEIVSTFPVTSAINGYDVVSDAIGDTYTDLGHTFYLINFVDADVTWAWDATNPSPAQGWAKRGTWISEQSRYSIWRPCYHAFVFGQHRMLDLSTGDFYRMSSSLTSDVDDREIRRLRQAPCLLNQLEWVFLSAFELDVEPGLGNTVDPGSEPEVMLQISRDGGKTWGNERWRSAGATGEYKKRVRWNRCGAGRRIVVRIVMTDPIQWRITGAYLELPPDQARGVA